MIGLDINKKPFWYCLYNGSEMIEEGGYKTGERRLLYGEPKQMSANISAAKGTSEAEVFGTELNYDRVIVTCDMDCPIDEQTVLFVEKEPAYDAAGNPLFDYVVKRVAKSLNVVNIAISRVEVTP